MRTLVVILLGNITTKNRHHSDTYKLKPDPDNVKHYGYQVKDKIVILIKDNSEENYIMNEVAAEIIGLNKTNVFVKYIYKGKAQKAIIGYNKIKTN